VEVAYRVSQTVFIKIVPSGIAQANVPPHTVSQSAFIKIVPCGIAQANIPSHTAAFPYLTSVWVAQKRSNNPRGGARPGGRPTMKNNMLIKKR